MEHRLTKRLIFRAAPEVVRVLEELVAEDRIRWPGIKRADVLRRLIWEEWQRRAARQAGKEARNGPA